MAFSNIPPSESEAAFGIRARAKAAGKDAIDCSVGELRKENGKILTFPSVRAAAEEVGGKLHSNHFSYQQDLGCRAFRNSIKKLLFGDEQIELASIATSGGCQALLFNMQLLKHTFPNIRLVRPVPEWGAYDALCAHSGLHSVKVDYLRDGKPTIHAIADAVRESTSAVLLPESSHNPTGKTHRREELREMAEIFKKHDAIALLDISYQGLSYEPAMDLSVLDAMRAFNVPTLISWSASKNHTLYSERVGLAAAIAADSQTIQTIEQRYASMMLPVQSPPASTSLDIVTTVQMKYKKEWKEDLRKARSMLDKRRNLLRKSLPEFSDIIKGEGFYTQLPLTSEQTSTLAHEHSVFMGNEGRLCLAGIPENRIEEVAQKIKTVQQ